MKLGRCGWALWLVVGCGADAVDAPPTQPSLGGQASTGGAAGATAGVGAGGLVAGAPHAGSGGSGGAAGGGGVASGGGGSGGAAGGGGAAGAQALGGTSGSAGAGGSAGTASAGSSPIPPDCKVSNPVSFKADVQPFLSSSCGKGKGNGCHVTDDASTAGSLCPDGSRACGFNHAYDWITAGSHNEFCKQTPGPIRFTVVVDVIQGAKPASCTASRVMPPDGPPPSACQLAALQAWLAEPRVVQLHRADDTSPAEPYPMPPFN